MNFKDGVGICCNDLYFLKSWRLWHIVDYFYLLDSFDINFNYIVFRFLVDASSGPSVFDSASDRNLVRRQIQM